MPLSFRILVFLLFASAAFAQVTEVPKNNREADSDFKRERDEWILGMHRAEPGLNWQAIDAETRNAKFESLQTLRKKDHTVQIQSVSKDTLAGGRVIGSWSERGSNNISGRMHTADIDFDNNIVYAASAMGNIWKADFTDPTKWTSLNDDRRFGDVRMLRIVTTSKGKRIIAAANGPATVYYSDDGGVSWQKATGLDGPKNWGGIKRACMNATEQTMYLFGSEWDYKNWKAVSTLYRSTDQGKSFSNLGKWDYSSDKCDVWVSRDTISPAYFLKGDSLFTIAANGSLHFVHGMSYVDALDNIGWLLLQGTVNGKDITLSVLQTGGGFSQIYYSGNGGNLWSHTGTMSGNPFGYNSFKILRSDPKIISIGTFEAFVSRDSGKTWDHINGWGEYYGNMKSKLHADIDGIDFIQDFAGNEIQLISTDGGIYMSIDALESFENITLTGIGTGQFYSVLTSRQAPYFVYGGTQDQGYQRTEDLMPGKFDMMQTISGDYGHLSSSNEGKSVWCDYPGFAMLYADAEGSTSNRRTWNFRGRNHLWLTPIVSDPLDAGSAYIACGGDTTEAVIWHLVNGTDSISYSHLPFDFSGGNKDRNISAIAFSPIDPSHVYIMTNDGQFFDSLGVDGKWKRSDSVFAGSHYFYGSVILPSKKDMHTLWIAGSGYSNPAVFLSTNEGKTFTPIDSGLPHTLVLSLAASEDEQFLFAATDVGPYVYSKEAGRWFDMSIGNAPDMVYWSVDYIPSLTTVRFGTHGRGIWDFAIDQMKNGVTPDSLCPPIPNFDLSAVPSVFSMSTTISFNLPSEGTLAVRIYDITGKLVRTVVNERLDIGWHHITWDGRSDNGSSLPSGYYTCIASGMGKSDFIKIDLVK